MTSVATDAITAASGSLRDLMEAVPELLDAIANLQVAAGEP